MGRVHLAGRGPAAASRAAAADADEPDGTRARLPGIAEKPPALPAPRARAERAGAVSRSQRGPFAEERAAPLVGRAAGPDDAGRARGARRDRGRGTVGPAARVGSRRTRLSARRDAALARRRAADRREETTLARRVARARKAANASGASRRARAAARGLPLAVRPADPRPRPRRGALRLLLPARDVCPEGEAPVRLLRPADPARRPDRRTYRRRAGGRPGRASGERCVVGGRCGARRPRAGPRRARRVRPPRGAGRARLV